MTTPENLLAKFVDQKAARALSAEARDAVWRLYVHEKQYRSAILETAPGSAARLSLTRQMMDRTWTLLNEFNVLAGADAYQSGTSNRDSDAAALRRLLAPGRAIEIGAGGGALCAALARAGWAVDGTDVVAGPDWSRISEQDGVRFHVGDASELDLPPDAFDLCILDNALEHLPPGDYEMMLDRVWRLLRPGGWFVAIVPNRLTGPHDVSKYFVPRGRRAEASHFNERRFSELAADLRNHRFRRLTTVAYAGVPAGRRFGWSRLWYWKARLSEALFSVLPASLRNDFVFACMVPAVIAAQK